MRSAALAALAFLLPATASADAVYPGTSMAVSYRDVTLTVASGADGVLLPSNAYRKSLTIQSNACSFLFEYDRPAVPGLSAPVPMLQPLTWATAAPSNAIHVLYADPTTAQTQPTCLVTATEGN